MRIILLAMFITMIISISIFGYFYENDPALEVEQESEEYTMEHKKESDQL